ncbi:DegT/DnrJ/EryC1/StrS family aminotransferase [uncultured Amphritea sp.]|uniref:DegT/DnrJ/EryC1/StrS family aminotransferase n=1 Tax=uncultured Amphritea sp. TaxID=981605 RepID=UPI002606AF13|nr:DegT/DnrJ/EryC1/StrS family aminotransferase [uncultured Amphritea sp.]
MNNVESVIVYSQTTLKEALQTLDSSGVAILLLVDQTGVLQRTVTDGDIRRLILAGFSLEACLQELDSKTPLTISLDESSEDALLIMDENLIDHIPVVDEHFRPVKLFLRRNIHPKILLSVPHMGDTEERYVKEAFDTNWIAPLGPNVDAFEKEISEYVSCGHAAALSSGTAAIHLALRLLDVGPGDIVFCSSFTFIASANPILYQGASPVFIDSEPSSWNMSPMALERALEDFSTAGSLPKAIIVVHLYGQSADMDAIMSLCDRYGVPVIEDAAESLGATFKGKATGTFGKFGIFSFNGNKIITTSGGGMLISDDEEMIRKARFLSTQARDDAPYYEHSQVGYNYRMSNVLAGIGRGQLEVLDARVEARRSIFSLYLESLSDIKAIQWMPELKGTFSNRWLTTFTIDPQCADVTPSQIIASLAEINIEARHLWRPMHKQPLFKDVTYYRHANVSVCDDLFERGLCLPSASNMDPSLQNVVIQRIRKMFQ